jgi:hypothetical protein
MHTQDDERMQQFEVSDQERQLIEILREWEGENDEYHLMIGRADGAWELKLATRCKGRDDWARGVGKTFAKAWDGMDPSWA